MRVGPRFNGRFIEGGGGVKLFVEAIGSPANPSILFIHGFSQCRLSWDRQFESALGADFYLVRIDNRGHGLSDKPRDAATSQNGKNWADDIHAVMTALDLNRPVLSGWSYGGYIMCDYVRHYGQKAIGGLNFVNAATELGSDEAAKMGTCPSSRFPISSTGIWQPSCAGVVAEQRIDTPGRLCYKGASLRWPN